MKKNRKVRRSQAIVPYGVGAVLDIGDESFVATDIGEWDKYNLREIHLNRLKRRLGKRLIEPPVTLNPWQKKGPSIPYFRFPRWFFCSSCRQMKYWRWADERDSGHPQCTNPSCRKRTLVPMRFVMACENGHLDDVPWDRWVHADKNIADAGRCEERWKLSFKAQRGAGGSLRSLRIVCNSCKSQRSLAGMMGKEALRQIGVTCRGTQPWERRDKIIECGAMPRVLQRGAGNLYYAQVVSALDIPEESDDSGSQIEAEIRAHPQFAELIEQMASSSGDVPTALEQYLAKKIVGTVGCDIDTVIRTARAENSAESIELPTYSESEVMYEEWKSLCNPPMNGNGYQSFTAEQEDLSLARVTFGLDKLIKNVVLMRRLREVRALRGFSRIMPDTTDRMIQVDLNKGLDWIPAVEVYGEGIFLRISEKALTSWENVNKKYIADRYEILAQRKEDAKLGFVPDPDPRFILLHTLSHLLIRQL
ncbi:MAG: hypothetical protein E2O84_01140, partial [Bacteroidetes bacterium]